MSFNGTESSTDLGSPYELYLFRYGEEMPDEISFSFADLPLPVDKPDGKVTFVQFSPNGRVLAVAYEGSLSLLVYRRNEDELFFIGAPELPAQPTCVTFSHDSTHMAVGMVNTYVEGSDPLDEEDNLAFYAVNYVSGNPTSVAAFAGTGNMPARPVDGSGQVHTVAYSADGLHLLVGHDGFPYLTFYSRSGNSYTKFSGLAENAPGPCRTIDYPMEDTCVVTTENEAPIVYHRAGSSYSREAIVPIDLGSGETVQSARFNPAGTAIAVCRSESPFLTLYSRDGATLAPMFDVIGGGPSSRTNDVYWDELGEGLIVTMEDAPYAMTYDLKGEAPIHTDEWDVSLTGSAGTIHGTENQLVVIGTDTLPYLHLVKRVIAIDDGDAGYYAYTNSEREITKSISGFGTITFEPIAINRDAYKANGKAEPTNMGIRLPVGANLANMFLPFPPPQPVGVVIYQGHYDDLDEELLLVWTGKILSVSREVDEAVLNCDNNVVSMSRLGLRRNYQFGCPYVLYGSLCKASRENASVKAVVISVTGGALTLSANWYQGRNPEDFAGGYISWRSKIGTEYRTINSVSSGGAISYVGPLRNIQPGTEVTITLGCNHQRSHCANLHNNINNFGGQPWIPLKNPVKYHPFW